MPVEAQLANSDSAALTLFDPEGSDAMDPSSPRSDRPAPEEDEPLLTREPLVASTPRSGREPSLSPRPRVHPLHPLTLVLVAVVVLAAGAAGLQHVRQPPPVRRSTSLSTPSMVPTLPPDQGWTPAGPAWAQQIVFAQSQPQTAYVCGTTIPSGQTPEDRDPNVQTPVVIGVSDDFGHTWQTLTTSLTGLTCLITVDPLNAHDLLLVVNPCLTCSTPTPKQLYRSGDGGRSWVRVQFPPLPALGVAGSAQFVIYWWAWQGSTVFVFPFSPHGSGTPPDNLLAVSVAGGPFSWVNEQALLAQVPTGAELNDLSATTSTVYADFFNPQGCPDPDSSFPTAPPPACYLTIQSTDLGASWTLLQPRYAGQPVAPFAAFGHVLSLADEQTLLGMVGSVGQQNAPSRMYTYVRSTDGGATWMSLPSPPGNLRMAAVAVTPRGILYGYMEPNNVEFPTAALGAYRLASGAGAWILVGAPAAGLQAISWDAQGQVLALWSHVGNSATGAGLGTHLP